MVHDFSFHSLLSFFPFASFACSPGFSVCFRLFFIHLFLMMMVVNANVNVNVNVNDNVYVKVDDYVSVVEYYISI